MDLMLETPSRVWRRIKDNEARNDDLPSLPSLSMDPDRDGDEHTASMSFHRPVLTSLKGFTDSEEDEDDEEEVFVDASDLSQRPTPTPKARHPRPGTTPIQSTPLASSTARKVRLQTPGSSGSRVRFANSIETRSYAVHNESQEESFDASRISYITAKDQGHHHHGHDLQEPLDDVDLNDSGVYDASQISAEGVYVPPLEDENERHEVSIVRETVPSPPAKRSPSPGNTSRSPFDPTKWSANINVRRKQATAAPVARPRFVPSLSHSLTDSSTEESTQLTPEAVNVSLPRSPVSRSPPNPAAHDHRDHDAGADAERGSEQYEEEQDSDEAPGLPQIDEEDEEDLTNSEQAQNDEDPFTEASQVTSADLTTRPSPRQQLRRASSQTSPASGSQNSISFSTPSSLNPSVNNSRQHLPLAELVPETQFQTPAPASHRSRPVQRESLSIPPQDYLASLATPAAKRAFHLIVTSTTKPRLKKGTPHPKPKPAVIVESDTTEAGRVGQLGDSDSGNSNHLTPGPVPPRRPVGRARFSLPSTHSNPLAFSHASTKDMSDAVSTTSSSSSHDLTIHPRANASFDPVFDTQGPRMDQNKLSAQLHRVNRMMEQENRALVDEKNQLAEAYVALEEQRNEVVEERDKMASECAEFVEELEEWKVREAEWENQREVFLRRVEDLEREREESEASTNRLKKEFEGRLKAAEEGVEKIVDTLTAKSNGQIKDLKERLRVGEEEKGGLREEVQQLRNRRNRDADSDERRQAEVQQQQWDRIRALESELSQVKEDHRRKMEDMQTLDEVLAQTTEQLARTKEALDNAKEERSLQLAKAAGFEGQIDGLRRSRDELEQRVKELDDQFGSLEDVNERMREQVENTQGKVVELDGQVVETDRVNAELEKRVKRLRSERDEVSAETKRLEVAVKELENRQAELESEKVSSDLKVAGLEREKEDLKNVVVLSHPADPSSSTSSNHAHISLATHQQQIQGLETELEQAHLDLGRLAHDLQRARETSARSPHSPARRVKQLEEEKRELEERVDSYKRIWDGVRNVEAVVAKMGLDVSMAAAATWTPGRTPAKATHKSVLALKTPRTPGAPLRDLSSWFNQSLFASPSPNPDGSHPHSIVPAKLQSEISGLMNELQFVNGRLDTKFEQLRLSLEREALLAKQVEEAKDREVELVREVENGKAKDVETKRRLERCLCRWCGKKFDASAALSGVGGSNAAGSPPSRSPANDGHKTVQLEKAEALVAHLETDKRRLEEEMAHLAAEAKRLNIHVGETQRAADKEKTRFEKELDKIQRVKEELEHRVKQGDDRLQSMKNEKERLARERKDMMGRVEQTAKTMDEVQVQLRSAKQHEQELENELRANSGFEQRVRHLEAKLSENQDNIYQLRQDRDSLERDRERLQSKISQMSQQMDVLRQQLLVAETAQDQARHQLGVHAEEVEELRSVIVEKSPIASAKVRSAGQQRQRPEKPTRTQSQSAAMDVPAPSVPSAADLKLLALRKDVERCLQELNELRVERDMLRARLGDEKGVAERAESQVQLLRERLVQADAGRKGKGKAEDQDHVCCAGSSGGCQAWSEQQAQHKLECKGLIVQIGYLKHRVTRESVMRTDLSYQKQYLLRIITVLEHSEKSILTCIARIGFPAGEAKANAERPRWTVKGLAVAFIFLARVRRASERWQEQSAARHTVAAALQDLHRRRELIADV